jgi:hypothetical protein
MEATVPAYILQSLITLRDEITERLMQNTEFRALQSLQRSIDEVSELAQREEVASTHEDRPLTPTLQKLNPASLVREHMRPEPMEQPGDTQVLKRVTPAHFTAAKRVI